MKCRAAYFRRFDDPKFSSSDKSSGQVHALTAFFHQRQNGLVRNSLGGKGAYRYPNRRNENISKQNDSSR